MRTRTFTILAALAVLSGCASLPQDAGFRVTEKSAASVRQEPWQNIAFRTDAFDRAGVAVAPVALPTPVPSAWQEDFIDPARPIQVKQYGRQESRPLQRVVFRAATYVGEAFKGLYDAVVNP